jgi:hypothetical protein
MTRWVASKAMDNASTAATYLAGAYYRLRQLDANHNSAHLHKRRVILAAAKRAKRGQVGKQGLYHHDLETELAALDADPRSTHGQYVSLAAASLALCAGLRAMDYAPTKASTTKRPTAGPGGVARPPTSTMRRSALTFGHTSEGVRVVRVVLYSDQSGGTNAYSSPYTKPGAPSTATDGSGGRTNARDTSVHMDTCLCKSLVATTPHTQATSQHSASESTTAATTPRPTSHPTASESPPHDRSSSQMCRARSWTGTCAGSHMQAMST